ARPATCRQREVDQRLQVRRGGRDQAVRLLRRQPAITSIFAGQQAYLRDYLDPLPLVARDAQQVAEDSQIAIHGSRLIAALQLVLGDAPDHITGDLAQLQFTQVRIDAPTDPPNVCETPKMLLAREIPGHGA